MRHTYFEELRVCSLTPDVLKYEAVEQSCICSYSLLGPLCNGPVSSRLITHFLLT